MDLILETSTAALAANVLVTLGKLAWPTMPSWALVALALFAGLSTTFLVSLAGGEVLTTQSAAANILQGLFAAATAAGVDRGNVAADRTRVVAKMEEAREQFAARGPQVTPR
jgi:hypothetical protein